MLFRRPSLLRQLENPHHLLNTSPFLTLACESWCLEYVTRVLFVCGAFAQCWARDTPSVDAVLSRMLCPLTRGLLPPPGI